MAGIEAAEEITSDQLDAMAGGELLKGEVINTTFLLHLFEYIMLTTIFFIFTVLFYILKY